MDQQAPAGMRQPATPPPGMNSAGISFVWNSIAFSASRYVLLLLSVVRNAVIAKVLGPAEFGTLVVISLLFTVGDQVHLGLRHAGEREIPFQRGRGEVGAPENIARIALGGIIMLSTLAFTACTAGSFLLPLNDDSLKSALPFVGMIIGVDQVNKYYLMMLRTKKQFVASSRIETVIEAVRTAVVILLVMIWRIPGLLAGFLLVSLILFVFFVTGVREIVRPRVEWRTLRGLMRKGIPLFLVGILFVVLLNLDRAVGTIHLSRSELGIYGIAAMVAQLPLSFSQAVGSVIYPSLNEQFGKTSAVEELFNLFSQAAYGIAYLIPIVAGTIYFGALIVLIVFLPSYGAAAPLLSLLIPGVLLVSLVPLFSGVLTASGGTTSFLVTELTALGGSFLVFFVMMPLLAEKSLSSLGISMTVTMIFFGSLMTVATYRKFRVGSGRFVKELLKSYFPFVYAIVLMFGILPVIVSSDTVTELLEGYGLFLLLYLPVLATGYTLFKPFIKNGVMVSPGIISGSVMKEGKGL